MLIKNNRPAAVIPPDLIQEVFKMTNQEIFDMLADNEEKLFYAYNANPTEELKAAHDAAKLALISFAAATGCHN